MKTIRPMFRLLLLVCLAMPLASCGRGLEVVARVGDKEITADEFVVAMRKHGGHIEGTYEQLADKKALLEEMIRFEVLVQKAREDGLFEDEELVNKFNRLVLARMERDILQEVGEPEDLTDEEVAAYYEGQSEKYSRSAKIKVAMIRIGVPAKVSRQKEKELRQRARDVRAEAKKLDPAVRNFGYLASKHSDDQASRYKGGELGWIARNQQAYRWQDEIVQVLFSLEEIGQVTPVLRADDGFYLFKLIKKKNSSRLPLEKVERNIRQEIIRQRVQSKMDAVYKAAQKKVKIKVDEKALSAVQPPARTKPDPRKPVTPSPMPSG